MVELFANSGDPDQTPRSVASDLGLLCLPVTLLGVSSRQWVKTAGGGVGLIAGSRMISDGVRFDQNTVPTLCIRKESPQQTM